MRRIMYVSTDDRPARMVVAVSRGDAGNDLWPSNLYSPMRPSTVVFVFYVSSKGANHDFTFPISDFLGTSPCRTT